MNSAPDLRLVHDSTWGTLTAAGDASEPVEEQLARLAAVAGPLRRVLAAIAAQLIETEAHARLCYARLGDYARERAGVSARQLQELARVHRELGDLPALEQTLVENDLPWSKVRLVARVATTEDEGAWIARAREVSTRRLEQEVRASRGDETHAEELPQRRVSVRCTPAVCETWSLSREVAERVAGQKLCAGDVLELVAAEVSSALPLAPVFAEEEPDLSPDRRTREPEQDDRIDTARATARELPRSVGALAAGLDEADPHELDRRLRRAVKLEQTLDAAIAPLLRVVTSPEYEWRGDYQTLSGYAREQLGMSSGKARALLRLERAGDVCPELREAHRSGRLSWVKASVLLPLLLLDLEGEWRPRWVAWAERVTVRRLTEDVERALLLRAGHEQAWQRCKFHPERAQDAIPETERQLCAHDVDLEATQELSWRVPADVASLFTAVRDTLRARLDREEARPVTDGEVLQRMLDHALASWTLRAPGAKRPDPVMEREGYRCAVPGCTSRCSLHDHHIVFRSRQGSDEEENRVALCAFHHQRCLHAHRMRLTGRAPDGLVFELGLRSGGAPLAVYRSGDIAVVEVRT